MLSLRRLMVLPIRFYQLFISPALPAACRYRPTCSEYAAEAIMRFGFLRGCWLALGRLCRCHPWGGSGYDPPPRHFSWFSHRIDKGAARSSREDSRN